MRKKCHQCGLCCRLFLINLNEAEYKSGEYQTFFGKLENSFNFSEARKYGLNLLAQNEKGECFYLKNNSCAIHKKRPLVCREFFCNSKSKKFKKMREMIDQARLG
jgi:Fe-S-cluster containining protein